MSITIIFKNKTYYHFSSRGLCNIVGVDAFQYGIDKGQSFAWNTEATVSQLTRCQRVRKLTCLELADEAENFGLCWDKVPV